MSRIRWTRSSFTCVSGIPGDAYNVSEALACTQKRSESCNGGIVKDCRPEFGWEVENYCHVSEVGVVMFRRTEGSTCANRGGSCSTSLHHTHFRSIHPVHCAVDVQLRAP
jgi:hypothetical protein